MRRLLCLLACGACGWSASDLAVYRLLPPQTHSFELSYDASVTRVGAEYFFNPVRPGSVVTKESAIDLATGKPLELKTVKGREAKASGGVPPDTSDDSEFLWVKLLRGVPKGAETRIRIVRTYSDPASYQTTSTGFIFDRPLAVTRNIIVLPQGYELIGSRSPGIVTTDADGRVRISFFNDRDDMLPVRIVGRKLP